MPTSRILLGTIGRAHGVQGLVRVASHTADPSDLAGYGPLSDESGRRFALRWRGEGLAEIAEITAGGTIVVADRSAAERLTNTRLYIDRDRLPPPDEDEFYLADLIGLAAVDRDGMAVGRVAAVHDYGGGASIEIERMGAPPLLLPFSRAAVPEVDIAGRRIVIEEPDIVEARPDGTDADARAEGGDPR